MSHREDILLQARSVPSLPPAAVKVVQLLQDPDACIADITRAIEYDPGLTSNVLRMANSAYFVGTWSVGSLQQAAVRLGTKRIFQLVMASAVSPLAQPAVRGYGLSPGKLWEHSITVAVGAEQLAAALQIGTPDLVFTVGLLHDIGKVVIGTFAGVDAAPIVALARRDEISFEMAEQRELGIDHAEAGAVLLDNWMLPEEIVNVVRWHHQAEKFTGGDTLTLDLVHVADILSISGGIGAGIDGLQYRPSSEVTSRLNLTDHVAEMVLGQIISEMEELRALFENGASR